MQQGKTQKAQFDAKAEAGFATDKVVSLAVTRMVQAARVWFATHPGSALTHLSPDQDRDLHNVMVDAASAELASEPDHQRTIARLKALGLLAQAQYGFLREATNDNIGDGTQG